MVKKGINRSDIRSRDGLDILHYAYKHKSWKALNYLIQRFKEDIDTVDPNTRETLLFKALFHKNDLDLSDTLIEAGASLEC